MKPSKKQALFLNMFAGVLMYSVVLGFFNDYTNILSTSSYSTTFFLAIVMQLLTYLTLAIKDRVKTSFKSKQTKWATPGLILGVWLILFLSKFVFLAVIEVIFSEDVAISGFIGLMLIVVSLTITQKLVELAYAKLAD